MTEWLGVELGVPPLRRWVKVRTCLGQEFLARRVSLSIGEGDRIVLWQDERQLYHHNVQAWLLDEADLHQDGEFWFAVLRHLLHVPQDSYAALAERVLALTRSEAAVRQSCAEKDEIIQSLQKAWQEAAQLLGVADPLDRLDTEAILQILRRLMGTDSKLMLSTTANGWGLRHMSLRFD
jgi:hypothetical protein